MKRRSVLQAMCALVLVPRVFAQQTEDLSAGWTMWDEMDGWPADSALKLGKYRNIRVITFSTPPNERDWLLMSEVADG